MEKNRSKRLRKKLFVNEFTKYGFEFKSTLNNHDDTESAALFHHFFEFLQQRGLTFFGGISDDDFDGLVLSCERYGSPTKDDRERIQQWLTEQPQCSEISIGELTDVNKYS